MANKVSNTEDILSLGVENTTKEEKKKKKKRVVFPILLVLLGAVLMVCGLFFNQITSFLGISFYNGKTKQKVVKEINE